MSFVRNASNPCFLIHRGIKKSALYARDHSVADGLNQVKLWNTAHLIGNDSKQVKHAISLGKEPIF